MADFDDDEVVVVGQPLPRILAVAPLDGLHVVVTWHPGARGREREVVDLGPAVARFKLYAPLRDDPALFATARVQDHGYGVAWGDGSIDMASTTIADAADETMTAEDFAAFMARHGFTLDRVAAELGISRRMAAYYKKQARVPRTVALACRYIDKQLSLPSDVLRAEMLLVNADPAFKTMPKLGKNFKKRRVSVYSESVAQIPQGIFALKLAGRGSGDSQPVEDIRR